MFMYKYEHGDILNKNLQNIEESGVCDSISFKKDLSI